MSSGVSVLFGLGLGLGLGLGSSARAESWQAAEGRARADYVPKVAEACDIIVTIEYDGASLRQHNPDIAHDQTDGADVCNEPLRYLWYACQTPAGRAAVKRTPLETIVCKGTPNKQGSLTLEAGTLTIERSASEKRAYERSRQRFQALFHVSVKFGRNGSRDPHADAHWRELPYAQPAAARSDSEYCLVNGDKREFDPVLVFLHSSGAKDGKLQCWKWGQKVVDLVFRGGKKTGLYTELADSGDRVFMYKDGKLHGERKRYRASKLYSVEMYSEGQIVWLKEFHMNGKVKKYSRGKLGYTQDEDGKIYSLECARDVGDDRELRVLCGFEEELVTKIYDRADHVSRVETWKNGVLQKRSPGE